MVKLVGSESENEAKRKGMIERRCPEIIEIIVRSNRLELVAHHVLVRALVLHQYRVDSISIGIVVIEPTLDSYRWYQPVTKGAQRPQQHEAK